MLNMHFLTIPCTTTANVTSAVPATQEFFDNRVVPPLQFDLVDVNTISSLVVDLDVRKAAGADGLSPRLLKASPYMVRLITILVNKCIASSSAPSQWKQANVTPVPKCKNCTTYFISFPANFCVG